MTDVGPELDSGDDWVVKLGSANNADVSKVTDDSSTNLWSVHGDGKVSGSVVKDEDAMTSDSDDHLATQQSIKAYADTKVAKSTYNANTILAANADDTPAALTVAEQTVVGRLTGGNIDDISLGISDNNVVQVDGSPADDEYAKWTANGLEGRSNSEMQTDLGFVNTSGTPVDDDYAKFTDANTIEGRSSSEMKSDLGYMTDLVDDTTPDLGGHLGVGELSIRLDPSMSANGKWSGITTGPNQTLSTGIGETISFGDPVYLNASGNWALCDATTVTAMVCAGISLGTCAENTTNGDQEILLQGVVKSSEYSLSVGSKDEAGVSQTIVYVGTTPGTVTQTAPSSTGNICQPIGFAMEANTLYFTGYIGHDIVP